MLRIILTIVLFSGSLTLTGQSIHLNKKALSVLASEEKVNVIFAYKDLVYNRQDLSETEFLKDVSDKINKHANNAMAQKWTTDFKKAKSKHWPELFITILNSNLSKYDNAPSFVLHNTSTRYIMVIHTHWMDFGYDIGVVKRPARANMVIYFYDNSDPLNAITMTKIHHAEGLFNESRYKNSEFPKPSLASMRDMYERVAQNLSKSLKRVVK